MTTTGRARPATAPRQDPAGPTASAAPALEVTDLTVRYGAVTALDGVTFALAGGRVTGLVGMNGSGKSTLFKSVMGLVRPTAGQVRVLGQSTELARRRGVVGYVPQQEDVDWSFPLSVREVVMMGRYGRLGLTRRPRRADHDAVDAALERVELGHLDDRQIGALSGGQRKRAFVARGLAQGAQVLLLDEPFAGVDKRTEATITTLLRELAADGRTILVSTHDLASLDVLCDDALLIQRRVLLHAPPAEVLRPENLARAFGVDVSDARPATVSTPSGAGPAEVAR
ncbi:metal ABC transporter ATP-binding protein [Georgenia yuyongxinii]|uniref:Metal ABC transporter ATP-binding protein n=1 Tax=Georgenia yuyongxinii TaxID=2589797 RepID=A0A5B8C445_9MICO|nr:metal ABC transporter ATP-binding protein [Georgenia yuyongxinii]QDC23882.1 metal ABC transporter ATP-binding protein [Georgenia yuyongxinii]